MGLALVLVGPRQVDFKVYDEPELGRTQVRLRTLYSGISAGTELSFYRGSNPYLHKSWNPSTRLFTGPGGALSYPMQDWGYEEVGQVEEIGRSVEGIAIGDIVWGVWGHRTTHPMNVSQAARQMLPKGFDPMLGIFTHIGAVALNGVLDAQINVGETVVTFGLGVPGQIAVQLAKLAGATVIAVDPIAPRRDAAHRAGAHVVLDPAKDRVAERVRELTGGRGADVCLEASGAAAGLQEAIRTAAYGASIVTLGFYQDTASLVLGEEFHHNRLSIVCSQIGGVASHLTHRWSRERLYTTVMDLQAQGRLKLKELITHIMPFEKASDAFSLLDSGAHDALQVILRFS